MSAFQALDLCGMVAAFCLLWPQRDEIVISVAAMFGLETEEEIARSAAALLLLSVIVWPLTLAALLEEYWPDA